MSEFTYKKFNDWLAAGKLMGSKCNRCEKINLPPRQICTECGSKDSKWYEFNGEGTIQTLTVNKLPSSKFKGNCPYVVGIIKLAEGPAISGFLEYNKEKKYDIGTKVYFKVKKMDDRSILAFEAK